MDFPHAVEAAALSRALGANEKTGLANSEVEARLRRHGPNRIPEPPSPSRLSVAGRQLSSPLVALLALAALVSLATGEALDAAVIAAIVVANAGLGYVQEARAERAVLRLHSLLAPSATVLRDGQQQRIGAERLVPGDIVHLAAGARVPADGRVLWETNLEADESTLTGESLPVAERASPPVPPEAPLAERSTMAYAGTVVTGGRGRILVTATGTRTEMGRTVAGAESTRPPRTPLQLRLDRLAGFLLRAAGAVCFAVAALAWLQGESVRESFRIGVSLAVAAVPEGLPAVMTVALAIGVQRLARHGAIVRRLQAVEALGSATVICTDKTGTLTEGRMALGRLYFADGGGETQLDGGGEREETVSLLRAAILASQPEPGTLRGPAKLREEPTEAAIAAAAEERGIDATLDGEIDAVVAVQPFDSERKRMSVVVQLRDGARVSYVKGAPEALLPLLAADEAQRSELAAVADRWAGRGVRVLLVARREMEAGADPEERLLPLGMLGLHDPPRSQSRGSVAEARSAGVRTVMITGDHPGTALAVARSTGIAPEGEAAVLSGPDLDRLSDEELRAESRRVTVFARVTPEHKVRIVEALRTSGEVVAMTGDGVNDVPALRAADIGVAMGRRGTDAARAAAGIVLTDDDYSTIVRAIRGGRAIYDNVLKFVHFLLAANAGEILVFALAIVLGFSAPLTVVQILAVNLLTDGLPAIALGLDPPASGVMRRGPRPPSQGLMDPIRTQLVVGGVATGGAAFASFLIGSATSYELGQTMAFTTLVFAQLVYVFAVRSEGPFWRAGRNPALYLAVLLSGTLQGLILAVPQLAAPFDVAGMASGQIAAALALALVPFAALEAFKVADRARSPRAPLPVKVGQPPGS